MKNIKKFYINLFIILSSIVILVIINSNHLDQPKDKQKNKLDLYKDKYSKSTVKTFSKNQTNGKIINPALFKSGSNDPDQIAIEYLDSYLLAKYNIYLDKNNIKITAIQKSPGGTTVCFHQVIDNITVYNTESSITINNKGIISWTNIFIRPEAIKIKAKIDSIKPQIIDTSRINESIKSHLELTEDQSLNIISSELNWFEANTDDVLLIWKVNVSTEKGTWGLCIDAVNGEVLQAGLGEYRTNAWGLVFKPDPLTSAKVPYGGEYINNNDANNSALNAERELIILQDIYYQNGIYKLEGPYCVLDNFTDPAGGPIDPETFPERTNYYFLYTRNEQEFEDVMCYYYIDQSARYVKSLGYWDNDGDPNDGLDKMKIDPHGSRGTSSFHVSSNFIFLRENASSDVVDAGEDADIILHEYCHALQHHLSPSGLPSAGLYNNETKAYCEGSSNYWAISYKASLGNYEWSKFGFWHYKGHTITDIPLTTANVSWAYPYEKDSYLGGQAWTSALMDIWWKIGKETTDKLFLETLHREPIATPNFNTSIPSLSKAAMTLINAEYDMYGGTHRNEVLKSLDKYGLVQYIDQIPFRVYDSTHFYRADKGEDHKRYDDFDVIGTDGADNEHFLHLDHAVRLNISTSSPNTNFDTKIEIFNMNLTSTGIYADNGTGPNPTHAMLNDIILPAGQYYIVVDGNNGEVGEYELSVEYSPIGRVVAFKTLRTDCIRIDGSVGKAYLCIDTFNNKDLCANRSAVGGAWEKFLVVDAGIGNGFIGLKSLNNNQYLRCSGTNTPINANGGTTISSNKEVFQLVNNGDGTVSLKCLEYNKYLCVDTLDGKSNNPAKTYANRPEVVNVSYSWEKFYCEILSE